MERLKLLLFGSYYFISSSNNEKFHQSVILSMNPQDVMDTFKENVEKLGYKNMKIEKLYRI